MNGNDKQMNLQTAVSIIKQTIDQAIKMGICQNIEATEAISIAWRVLRDAANKSVQFIAPGNSQKNDGPE